jgi:hypothetical protein
MKIPVERPKWAGVTSCGRVKYALTVQGTPGMSEFDVEAFVSELAAAGMKLTAVPMADGTIKIYRWRMTGAFEHAKQIEALWATQIGNDPTRMGLLAPHISGAASPAPLGERR